MHVNFERGTSLTFNLFSCLETNSLHWRRQELHIFKQQKPLFIKFSLWRKICSHNSVDNTRVFKSIFLIHKISYLTSYFRSRFINRFIQTYAFGILYKYHCMQTVFVIILDSTEKEFFSAKKIWNYSVTKSNLQLISHDITQFFII